MIVLRLHLAAVLVGFLAVPESAAPVVQASPEAKIKAAYLYNFIRYTTWPEEALKGPDSPFVIGILEDDPVDEPLRKIIRGKRTSGRAIELRTHGTINEALGRCHLVYLYTQDPQKIRAALEHTRGRSILTVAEVKGFIGSGGIIGFYLDGKKLRFEISPRNAQDVKLAVSSKLLRVGKVRD